MSVHFVKTTKDIIDLDKKLLGEIPINREELIILVNTHGRKNNFMTYINDIIYDLEPCDKSLELDLSNLDVSLIDDFSQVFCGSPYNGDLYKWNFSKAEKFTQTFMCSDFNNDSLRDLDFKNIKVANDMFYKSEFCGDISGWVNYQNTNFQECFFQNYNFLQKYYPNYKEYLLGSGETKDWLDNNLDRIREINIPKEDVLDYFNFDR